jgi:hypothetical protein
MRALTAAAVLVALATPAMAFTAAPQDPPLCSGIYLTCKPPLDRSDRDPVVSTMVSVEFLSDTNHHVKSFDVIHNLRHLAKFAAMRRASSCVSRFGRRASDAAIRPESGEKRKCAAGA